MDQLSLQDQQDADLRDWAGLPPDLLAAILRPQAGASGGHKSVRLVCRHFRDVFDAGVTRVTLQWQPWALRGGRSLPPVPRCVRVAKLDAANLDAWRLAETSSVNLLGMLQTWRMGSMVDAMHNGVTAIPEATPTGAHTGPLLELDLSGYNSDEASAQQLVDMLRNPAFAPGGLQVLDLRSEYGLHYAAAPVFYAQLPASPQLSALRELRVSHLHCAAELCGALATATHLRSLTLLDFIGHCQLGSEGAAALASAIRNMPTLQHLTLHDVFPAGAAALPAAVAEAGLRLVSLDLSKSGRRGGECLAAWADALAASSCFEGLQELDVRNSLDTDADWLQLTSALQAATHLTALRKLVLFPNNKGSPARLTQLLAAAPHLAASLEHLSLYGANVRSATDVDAVAAPLVAGMQLPRLTCLDLSLEWCGVELSIRDILASMCAMLRAATQLSGLQELDINIISTMRDSSVGHQLIPALVACTHLSRLRVLRMYVGAMAGPATLARLLRDAPHLRGLTRLFTACQDLTGDCSFQFTQADAAALHEALALLPHLRALSIGWGYQLCEDNADALVGAVQGSPYLHELQELAVRQEAARTADDLTQFARKVGALVTCTRLSSLRSLHIDAHQIQFLDPYDYHDHDGVYMALGDALGDLRHLSCLRQLRLDLGNGDQRLPTEALGELQRRLAASHLGKEGVTLRIH